MTAVGSARERLADARGGLRDRLRERRASIRFRRRTRGRNAEAAPDAPRHVLLVVVDALRADAVTPAAAPFLSGLDGGAAVSPSTWTVPAVSSLLTGRYPHAHGAMRDSDAFEVSVADVTGLPDPTDATTLPETLAAAGYETYGAFGFVVPFLALSGRFGTNALYDDARAERLLADHRDWIADRREERTVSYLHLADLHEPVDPPRDYWRANDVAELEGIREWRHEAVVDPSPTAERYRDNRRRLYRAAVEYVDDRLEAYLRRVTDLVDDVAVVVTADHGEALWERAAHAADRFADPRPAFAVGHGGAPYEAVTRVPLRVSGLDADLDGRQTSLVDVAPTVARAAGVEFPATDGVPFDGGEADGWNTARDDRVLLTEGVRYGYEKKAAYGRLDGDRWKLVVSRGDGVADGFALPEETVREIPAPLASTLREALPPWPDGGSAGREPSRDVKRRLERLGYR